MVRRGPIRAHHPITQPYDKDYRSVNEHCGGSIRTVRIQAARKRSKVGEIEQSEAEYGVNNKRWGMLSRQMRQDEKQQRRYDLFN